MRRLYLNIVVAIWSVTLLTSVGVAVVASAAPSRNALTVATFGQAVPTVALPVPESETGGTTATRVTPLVVLFAIAVPLSLMLSLAIARYLVHPLRVIEEAARRLGNGDLTARVRPFLGSRAVEITDFANAFDRMAERIERLVCTHKDVLRDVSHELRAPLARAQAALSLARQRTSDTVDPELDRLETEIERLDSVIGRLLTFSRLDSGGCETAREPVEFTNLVVDVVGDCRYEAEANLKSVELLAADGIRILGDCEMLASCLENVIRNAIRHTRVGTGVSVLLMRDQPRKNAVVIVRDRGRGVPDNELQRIFEPFYRLADADSNEGSQSGIGLAIAKRAVTIHGGTIDAANAPDGGLLVTMTLPLSNFVAPVPDKVAH